MRKLKAGALQLTLFIGVVIALLLGAFIILISTKQRFDVQSNMLIESIKKTNYGMDYVLKNRLPLKDSLEINRNENDIETLKIYRDYWGFFEKVTVNSTIKNRIFNKIALIGAVQERQDRTALYLQDNKKPLVIVGNTRIQGTAYLPKRGVKTGNISGQSYYGQELIYGLSKIGKRLPEILPEPIQQISNIQKQLDRLDKAQIIDLGIKRHHTNSFHDPVKYLISNTEIRLSEMSLIGHIIVKSNKKIIVDASSNLQGVVLVAPKIQVLDNVQGNFQAIASEEIKIGKNCKFEYPSALVLKENFKTMSIIPKTKEPKVFVDAKSNIKGTIVYLGFSKRGNSETQVSIDESASIIGEVYCNGNLEMKGTVYGSVFTNNFIANQSGSIYQNHLYNATINIDRLPTEYVGIPFKNSDKGVMEWLY